MAVAKIVSSSSCKYCNLPLKAVRPTCGRCFKVSYCDTDCQRLHWKYHKRECVAQQASASSTTQKTLQVAVSQSLIPKDVCDRKENFFLESTALQKALAGKRERWVKTHNVREFCRNEIWPSQAQSLGATDYSLKFGLDTFFANQVKLNALVLGAGACNNVAVLIDVGFIHITAVDHLKGFKTIAEKTVDALKGDNNLLEVALLEKTITPEDREIFPRDNRFGVIMARKIFEFCAPDHFENFLTASYASLEKGGCFIVSVNLLDSAKPDLYDRYWKGGEWGFTSLEEVSTTERFLKSIGFDVRRLSIDYGPNDLDNPEVLFFCIKWQ